jgi:hypothetical protein
MPLLARSPYAASPRQIGKAARAFLLDPDGWTSRHVEHFDFVDDVFLRRRLTVDLQLPERGGSLGRLDSERLYMVPAVVLRKDRPVSELDLCNEAGRSLPLLTRAENAAISGEAVVSAAEKLAGGQIPKQFAARIRAVAANRPHAARQAYEQHASSASEAALRRILAHPQGPALDRFINRMIDHSVVWVPLRGRPGQRRLVKLSYVEPPEELQYKLSVRFGLRPASMWILTPSIPESGSYHLQVLCPQGVEVYDLEPVGRSVVRPGEQREYDAKPTPRGAHIYINSIRGEGEFAISLSLRIKRALYIGTATLASAFIALLLAGLALCTTQLAADPEALVPILLVAPALLVVFAIRREHPMVTTMLSGIRLLVLAAGVLPVLSALNVAGLRTIRLPHIGQIACIPLPHVGQVALSLHAWWTVWASIAATIALYLVGVWLHAGKSVRLGAET